ncbi:MAG: hypothetical protein AAF337_00510 [Pseudomonadota bacterium]
MSPDATQTQPGLADIVLQLSQALIDSPDDVHNNASIIKDHVEERFGAPAAGPFDPDVLDQVAPTFMARMDLEHGGITGAPKFPNTPYFEHLWRAYLRSGKADYAASVQLTYTHMSQGALYDHVAGGYFRYSQDGQWKQPDLEKTLYDNALILKGLCHLHGNIPQALYATRIRDTAAFICSELLGEDGALISGHAAPEDATLYAWSQERIASALSDPFQPSDAQRFTRIYGDGKDALPQRLSALELKDPNDELVLSAIASQLAAASAQDRQALKNPLVITSAAMLAVISLVHAGKLLQHPPFVETAKTCFDRLFAHLEHTGQLPHCTIDGETGPDGLLDDYAASGLAAIALACAFDEPAYLQKAERLATAIAEHFTHASGAFMASVEETPFGAVIPVMDQPVPSGNAMAIRLLWSLSRLRDAPHFAEAASQAAIAVGGEIHNNFMGLGSLFAAMEDIDDPIDIAWTPGDYDSETIAWALAPPGALIVPPALQAQHSAAPIQAAHETAGVVLCRKDSQSIDLPERAGAIDALRSARRLAPEMAGGMIL